MIFTKFKKNQSVSKKTIIIDDMNHKKRINMQKAKFNSRFLAWAEDFADFFLSFFFYYWLWSKFLATDFFAWAKDLVDFFFIIDFRKIEIFNNWSFRISKGSRRFVFYQFSFYHRFRFFFSTVDFSCFNETFVSTY